MMLSRIVALGFLLLSFTRYAWEEAFVEPQVMSVDEVLALPNPDPDARIPYGEDPLQFGELRLPPGDGPHPVAVVVHGGCWRARYDIGHIGNFSDAFAKAGVATWTLEYRRVGNQGGGWPGTFLDVARGTDAVRDLAKDYPLDLNRVVAVGHSAGGHLVLWLGARSKLPLDSPLRAGDHPLALAGIVSLAGVDNLRRALMEGVCDDMAAQLIGASPDENPERYQAASPIELLPTGVPQRLVHGVQDPIVPVAFGRDYAAEARSAGEDVALYQVEGAGHFELIAPQTDAWRVVRRSVFELLGMESSSHSDR